MSNDHLDDFYQLAERAYIRMQAGDVLTKCMDDSSIIPLYELVESLVVAGPKSLAFLKEIYTETSQRKQQLEQDLRQVVNGLSSNLESYGFHMRGAHQAVRLVNMRPKRFMEMLRAQGVTEDEVQKICWNMLKNARDILIPLTSNHSLLESMEHYLDDWLWGVYYLMAHQEHRKAHPAAAHLLM